jgi:7-cyano-7-deazaguanine synthase
LSRASVVLLSGGMDSAVACALARNYSDEVHCLTFAYGQRHISEIAAAREVAHTIGVDSHHILNLPIGEFGGSSLTNLQVPVPSASISDGIPSTYVPARNLVFLSVASSFAEANGCSAIYLGINAVDYSGYPDCRPEFLDSFRELLHVATKSGVESRGVPDIVAPLQQLSKTEIVQLANDLHLDLSRTVSCYGANSDGQACGECDACALRRRGFESAGRDDPTRYQPHILG